MENHRERHVAAPKWAGHGSFGAATAKFKGTTPGAVSTLYSVSVYIWRFSKMGDPQVTMGFEYVTKLS